MIPNRERGTIWVALTALAVLVLAAAAVCLVLASEGAQATVTISTSTTYKDRAIEWTEDVVVTSGAKLTLRNCDVTFKPSGTSPLYLLVASGSLEAYDSDLAGQGAGFIIKVHGPTVLRNVTASGLGYIANSTLGALGLPMAGHGGIMAYGTTLTVYNLDIASAPATALYAEDCTLDVFSLGVHDACSAYPTAGQCAAVAIVYAGDPGSGPAARRAVLNSSKIQTSKNVGLLIAASGTDYEPTVELRAVEVSSGASDAIVVYEVRAHGHLKVVGDAEELNHNKGSAIVWVRSSTGGDSEMDISSSRIYNDQGTALRVLSTYSSGTCELTLRGTTVEDCTGHGAWVASTGCTQALNVTLSGCTVRRAGGSGAYFTTDGDSQTSQYYLTLEDTVIESPAQHGVFAKASQCYAGLNVTLDGTTVSRAGADGVHLEYSLAYFSWNSAPSAVGNLTIKDSRIAGSRGYAVYDSRYLTTYYQWAQARSTLTAFVNLLGSTFENHTRTQVYITTPSQLAYCSYSEELVVRGCTFRNATGAGVWDRVDSLTPTGYGTTSTRWTVAGSTFDRLGGGGFYVELRRADSANIEFLASGCDFTRIGDSALALWTQGQPNQGNLVASVAGCTFSDIKNYAVLISPGRPGPATDTHEVELARLTMHNTTGAYVSLDGVAAVDGYAVTVREVAATETRGDAIRVHCHPYQSAEMTTRLDDIYAKGTNGTALAVVLTSDRAMPLWGDVSGDNITLLDSVDGMFLQDHTGRLSNLTVRASTGSDVHKVDLCIPPDRTGILELHVATLDRTRVTIAGAGSLWVFNRLTVRVEWQNGLAALGAGVQVLDRTFSVVAVGHVESEAGMAPVELLGYIMDRTELRSRSPFIVNITFLDLEQTAVCSLDEPADVLIRLWDRVAPSMVILEPDDGAAQRATRFEVRGSAFDAHAGIREIRYSLDGAAPVAIGTASPFRTTVSDVSVGDHVLEVEVEDRAGNVAREVVRIQIDNMPPRLVVSTPAGDALVRERLLTIIGETEEGATVSINGENVTSTHGLFIAQVPLEEGQNTVTVVAMDRLSNVETVRFNATLDTVEPFLDVTSHRDGDWVALSDQVLEGVIEAGCSLSVAGLPVEVTNASFAAPVHLFEGDNLVALTATDPAGNVLVLVLHLRVATDLPWVNLQFPAEGALYDRREVRVLGTVEEGATATVNGRAVTIKQGMLDELLVLPEGASTITVEARDRAGNLNTVSRTVRVDTVAPVLTLDPLPAATRQPLARLTGVAEGASRLYLGGTLVELGPNGTFSVEVQLVEGTNTLALRAVDEVGHEALASAEVVLDTTAPFLRVLMPDLARDATGGYLSRTGTVLVQVVSEPGAKVTARGVYLILGPDGTATIEVPLQRGAPTRIDVLAEDALGNNASVGHVVTYEPSGKGAGGVDAGSLMLPLLNIALVAGILVVVLRYRSMVKRSARKGNGGGHRRNGRSPQNGGGAA